MNSVQDLILFIPLLLCVPFGVKLRDVLTNQVSFKELKDSKSELLLFLIGIVLFMLFIGMGL